MYDFDFDKGRKKKEKEEKKEKFSDSKPRHFPRKWPRQKEAMVTGDGGCERVRQRLQVGWR